MEPDPKILAIGGVGLSVQGANHMIGTPKNPKRSAKDPSKVLFVHLVPDVSCIPGDRLSAHAA